MQSVHHLFGKSRRSEAEQSAKPITFDCYDADETKARTLVAAELTKWGLVRYVSAIVTHGPWETAEYGKLYLATAAIPDQDVPDAAFPRS